MKNVITASARAYTPFTLKLYDWWVLNISNRYAWRCPTKKYLLPHFIQNTGNHHLDIGVGTGYYLRHTAKTCVISLADINDNSLLVAAKRAGNHRIRHMLQHDVFTTFPDEWHNQFDSVSIFYLLHCLPGSMLDKAGVIKNAAATLKEKGTLFGATILGNGVIHNTFGYRLMNIYNKKGIFSNHNDSGEHLRQILAANFHSVTIRTEGVVALFTASGRR